LKIINLFLGCENYPFRQAGLGKCSKLKHESNSEE